MGFLGSAGLMLLALLGSPLFIVILAAAMLGFLISEVPLTVIGIEMYRIVETPMLLALPLFTFSGYVLAESGMSQRLVRLTAATLGWLPGGLALVAFVTCAFFTAFTGASGVTIVAIGALLYPALQQGGYTERFSLGLVTTSGSLGLLLAPSLPLILYGVLVQQMDLGVQFSIQDLFLAGLMPAALMIIMLTAYTVITQPAVTRPVDEARPSVRKAAWSMRWELPMPVVVLGGIYSGFFCRIRGRRDHGFVRIDRRGGYPSGDNPFDFGAHYPRSDGHGGGDFVDSGRVPCVHEFSSRLRSPPMVVRADSAGGLQSADLFVTAQYYFALAGRDTRYFFSLGDHDPSDRAGSRCSSEFTRCIWGLFSSRICRLVTSRRR